MLGTVDGTTLGVEAALDGLGPTANLLLNKPFAALAEDELVLDVLETAEGTTLEIEAIFEELA